MQEQAVALQQQVQQAQQRLQQEKEVRTTRDSHSCLGHYSYQSKRLHQGPSLPT